MDTIKTRVAIIGSGAAGYTAAIYTARSNLQPLLLLGHEPGGQLTLTQEVENFPGFADPVLGPDLMDHMHKQAENVGTKMMPESITRVDFSQRPFHCYTDSGKEIIAESVIIATGAQARWLNIPGEEFYRGYGVSSCATCDGFFFKGKTVAVVGGGNTAVEEAIFLSSIAQKVILIHRRDTLRATPVLQERLFALKNVEFKWDSTVTHVHGAEQPRIVSHISLSTKNGPEDLETQALFVAIGHTPSTQVFKEFIDVDEHGYALVRKGETGTNIPGVFVAGDVQDSVFRQAITAAAKGCMAALEAEKFLA